MRGLRHWLKKTARFRDSSPEGALEPPSPRGRSRFLAAKFKDSSRELAYRLYLPSGSSPRDSLPLFVMLHGCKQDSQEFAAGTRMNLLAEEGRFAVLYPEQSQRANPLRCWNWFESASLAGAGEAALIARLIVQVSDRRPIDPRRIYLVGMSAGGAMACVLAARHSRLFAACATHSGVMYGAAQSPLQALAAMRAGPNAASIDEAQRLMSTGAEPAVAVPTLVIHGERDTIVNPLNAQQIIEQLILRAASIEPAAGPITASAERSFGADRVYRQQDYSRQGRVLLRRILVDGLGHAWSGGDSRFEFNDSQGPDASRLVTEFVTQYQRLSDRA